MLHVHLTGKTLHHVARLLGTVTIGMFAGCSDGRPATYPVEGRVTFEDGTPVTSGTVEFESLDSRINARGSIHPDGTFRLSTFEPGDGAVAGRHRSVVVQLLIAQADRTIQHSHGPEAAARAVHPRHASYETSGLEFDVSESGRNSVTIMVDAAR